MVSVYRNIIEEIVLVVWVLFRYALIDDFLTLIDDFLALIDHHFRTLPDHVNACVDDYSVPC